MTFRFAAPNATRVTVTGITGFFGPPIAMQKDERAVWTATSDPLAPEIYQYNFMVDGARITDPSNSMFMALYHRMDLYKELMVYLDARGVKYTYVEVPNQRHWWPLWHRNFAEFAQLIFK